MISGGSAEGSRREGFVLRYVSHICSLAQRGLICAKYGIRVSTSLGDIKKSVKIYCVEISVPYGARIHTFN